jgi:hypothetical protein
MIIIIFSFIEIGVCAAIFYFFPKKYQYEKEYLVDEYNENYDNQKIYNISICDYYVENLKKPKEMSLIIFGLSILLLIFVVSRFITAIYNKCKNYGVNSAIRFIRASVILGFFIIIANLVLIFLVLKKIINMYSDIDDAVVVTDSLIKCLKMLLYIFGGDIILFIIQICVAFKKYKIGVKDTPPEPDRIIRVIPIQSPIGDNYQINSVTTRSNVNLVRNEKKLITLLKRVLPEEVSSNLDEYIERGKYIIVDLIDFYLKMKFEGLTEKTSIIIEINNIIMQLSELLIETGDEVVKICFENIKEEESISFLYHYLFPLAMMVIKLKIEKGIYRKCQRDDQILVLTQLERTIEKDENGNERQVFRIRQKVSQASIENLLG